MCWIHTRCNQVKHCTAHTHTLCFVQCNFTEIKTKCFAKLCCYDYDEICNISCLLTLHCWCKGYSCKLITILYIGPEYLCFSCMYIILVYLYFVINDSLFCAFHLNCVLLVYKCIYYALYMQYSIDSILSYTGDYTIDKQSHLCPGIFHLHHLV